MNNMESLLGEISEQDLVKLIQFHKKYLEILKNEKELQELQSDTTNENQEWNQD